MTIALGRLALRLSLPRMPQDVASLEVGAIGDLLEDEILWEARGVVADVETSQEDVHRPARSGARSVDGAARFALREPEDAELAQLLRRERIRGAGVAPAHVPRVFQEYRAHGLALHLLGEHRPVELRELVLHVDGKVRAGRQPHGAIVRRLHPALARERVDEQLLISIGVQRAQSDGQHELRRVEGHLERAQIRETQPALLLQVDASHEEFHPLLQIAAEYG